MARHVNMSSEEWENLAQRQRRSRASATATSGAPENNNRGGRRGAPGANKYNAQKTEYNGRRYDSKMEARAAQDLDAKVAAGELVSWRPQVQIVVPWPGTHEVLLKCRIDFQLTWPDGRVTYLEVKGMSTEAWKLRHRILLLAGIPVEVRTK